MPLTKLLLIFLHWFVSDMNNFLLFEKPDIKSIDVSEDHFPVQYILANLCRCLWNFPLKPLLYYSLFLFSLQVFKDMLFLVEGFKLTPWTRVYNCLCIFLFKMPVIKEKTFTLETTYLVQKASMDTVYMENVNSFIPLRRLPAGKSFISPKYDGNHCKA